MSRRWRYPRTRGGEFYGVVPTQALTAPSVTPQYLRQQSARRLPAVRRSTFHEPLWQQQQQPSVQLQTARAPQRLRLVRRGEFFTVPLVGAAPAAPPAWVPPVLDSRRAPVRTVRRGEFYPVVPVAVAATPPAFVPAPTRAARIRGALRRCGRFWGLPAPVGGLSTPTRARARAALPLARRGRFWAVAPAPVAAAPPVWPPSPLARIRVRLATVRRGEFFTVPLVGQAPTPPPAVPPQVLRERVRLPWARRGRFTQPPWPQQAAAQAPAWVPPIVRQHQPGLRMVRRGWFTPVPPARYVVPSRVASRRPPNQPARRGRFWQPSWRFVPPGQPGPLAPRVITQPRRPPARPTRRGVFIEPPWPSLPHACTTTRPSSGVTARTSSGTTVRPDDGVTQRPCVLT